MRAWVGAFYARNGMTPLLAPNECACEIIATDGFRLVLRTIKSANDPC
jgi:hypothetical protein